MARRRKIDIEADSLELLSLTMRGAKARYIDAAKEGYAVDAATISASVSLLKLVEAFKAAKGETDEAELERLRQEFQQRSQQQGKAASPAYTAPSRADVLSLYGLPTDPIAPTQ
ncbi:hypothetical protein PQS90_05000 [Pseudomonas sp. BLCC-B13]|uniref:hypothetical protein n=1 Tax=Pseudomonas sp. BLCC-B13 TaxID=3025314 RepID=UPI00234E7471|nr:hypothetical protein [Pseudomonas sp. BLCC-B13]MDC7824504.1 hypothetical protein [Pseudomonas sp. BLCC-B13]